MDEMTLNLHNPLTEEEWDLIEDVDFEHTDRIWFHTKNGKHVEFVKVARCAQCKYAEPFLPTANLPYGDACLWCAIADVEVAPDGFCVSAERRHNEEERKC